EVGGLALLAAVALLTLGFVTSSDRPRVLARAGRWALRAGLGWAAFGWALPYALTKVGEPRLAALGALGVAAVGPMIAPAVTLVCAGIGVLLGADEGQDRKSTRLNSSHLVISYAVFCLKKKKKATTLHYAVTRARHA